MDQSAFVIIALVAVGLVVALGILAWKQEQKRIRAITMFCTENGLQLSRSRDRGLSRTFSFIPQLANGDNRYAENVIRGSLADFPVIGFDHHYETESTDSEGRSTTHHHHHCVYAVVLDESFPHLAISPEGLFSKVAQAFGYDDIDFESHEFSRKFCVRSKDRKFAYDFCNPAMIEFLIAHPPPPVAVSGNLLALVHDGRQDPAKLQARFDQVLSIRRKMPEYLFAS